MQCQIKTQLRLGPVSDNIIFTLISERTGKLSYLLNNIALIIYWSNQGELWYDFKFSQTGGKDIKEHRL